MKLKTPIKLNDYDMAALTSVKMKMLFINKSSKFLLVSEFETEVRVEQKKKSRSFLNMFQPPEMVSETNTYLTSIEFWGFNNEKSFWGSFGEDAINWYLTYYDFMKLRANYEQMIKLPLALLGFEITKIKTEETDAK